MKESEVDMERIIEVLKCLEEDNPNNIYNLEYTDNGKVIVIEFVKEEV